MEETPDIYPESCPDCILSNVGCTFAVGAIGGSAFHFLKGVYNSPKGARLVGASQAIRTNAPRIGGRFAVCSGLFSTLCCSMEYLRQKEDPWNSTTSGAAASGLLSMRRGLRAALRWAVAGGAFCLLMEGGCHMLIRAHGVHKQEAPPKKIIGGAKWEDLESLDSPVPRLTSSSER